MILQTMGRELAATSSLVHGHDTHLFSVLVNQTNRREPNALVDSHTGLVRRFTKLILPNNNPPSVPGGNKSRYYPNTGSIPLLKSKFSLFYHHGRTFRLKRRKRLKVRRMTSGKAMYSESFIRPMGRYPARQATTAANRA